ncbi:MAG: T9SS type A sorting domain-containing protein [Bacteroidales bacterium]|nr:T9SS type A sorting domain-containing protein [Bacteroidales bacterium]
MTRKLLLLTTLLVIALQSGAQHGIIELKRENKEKQLIQFAPKSGNTHRVKISIDKIHWEQKQAKDGNRYTQIWFDKSSPFGELGTPSLPAYKKLVILPYGATATARLTNYTQTEVELTGHNINSPLVPIQPSVRKDQDSTSIPFQIKKEAYAKQSYSKKPRVELEILGNMRNYTIARLVVTPIDYNPTANSLKVLNDIEIDINVTAGTKSIADEQALASPYFNAITQSALNTTKSAYTDHPELTKYPIKMLVVSDRMFETSLAPFIAWKKQKGINVITAYTDEIGTTAEQIKQYIQQQYNAGTTTDPAPTFLIFVGDVEQVPSSAIGSKSGKKTDLYYASIDGDIFPEIYYGRMSAKTTEQLNNIINKILYYEKYEFTDPTYLNQVTLIAGDDDKWNPAVGQPTIKYATANYFNTSNGFTTVNEYGVTDDPNNDSEQSGYTGCYNSDKVSVGLINYTAHCSETTWHDPSLSISNINAFTNQAKYPLAVANCCLSGDFGTGECIGEAWIRAANKGAVTYIGSSPSSYWQEDMYWAVGAFPMQGENNGYVPTLTETTTGAYDAAFASTYRTTGAMVFTGNLAVTEAYNQAYPNGEVTPTYYWEAYNILGDPSLMPYLTQAQTNNVTHETSISISNLTVKVTATAGSYVSITKNSEILGTAYFEQTEEKNIAITSIWEPETLTITATKPQAIPYIGTIETFVPNAPFLKLKSFTVNDQTGNNNGQIDFGETIAVDLTTANVGTEPATSTTVTIANHEGFAQLTSNASVTLGDLGGSSLNPSTNTYTFNIAPNVPDNSVENFGLTFNSNEGSWTSTLRLTINAPKLSVGDIRIDDSTLGNNNSKANAGEEFYGEVAIANTGHADVSDLTVNLTIPDSVKSYVTLSYEPTSNFAVKAGSTAYFRFTMTINSVIGNSHIIPVVVDMGSASNSYVTANATKTIEIIPEETIKIGNGTFNTCFALFTDSGRESAPYSSYESYTTTITSGSEGKALKVSFSEFDTEKGYDYLYIYDGESVESSQVKGSPFSGTTIPKEIYATGRSLTFKFTSDQEVTAKGWIATVNCVSPSTSIAKQPEANTLKVYPNPTTDIVNIESEHTMQRIQVIDIAGSVLIERKPNGQKFDTIPMGNMKKGSYIIRIFYTNGNVANAKLIRI